MSTLPKLIAIVGPTASGKSTLALTLAKRFHGAILSADSQQVYHRASIGTNQPKGTWRATAGPWRKITREKKLFLVNGIPHFCIDTLSPNKSYSAAQFQKKVKLLCDKLYTIGYVPIVVGGTGLYVSAVVEGFEFPAGKPNLHLRKSLSKKSLPVLLTQLKKLDPTSYTVIDKQNHRRVVRALEYVNSTGKSFLGSQARHPRPSTLIIGLAPSKQKLRQAIATRTRSMLQRGLVHETAYLKLHYPSSQLLHSIGYRESITYLRGVINRAELAQHIASHTWQYARRQMAWFKRMPNVHWIKSTRQAERLTRTLLHDS